jgi:hypothetical protein
MRMFGALAVMNDPLFAVSNAAKASAPDLFRFLKPPSQFDCRSALRPTARRLQPDESSWRNGKAVKETEHEHRFGRR